MRMKKRDPRSLLASSINSSAYRSGLDRLAPRKPTMITPCALSLRLSTIVVFASGMDAFASIKVRAPAFMLPRVCSTSCFISSALTSPKT